MMMRSILSRLIAILVTAFCVAVLVKAQSLPEPGYKAPLFTTAYRVPTDADAGSLWLESIYLPPVTTGPWAPAWSPNGKEIAFAMQGSLWRVSANGGDAVEITVSRSYDSEPNWSRDGKQLVFTRDDDHTIELWLVNRDGTDVRQLTHNGAVNMNPHWSPTSPDIVYVSSSTGTLGLHTVSAQNGTERPLLTDGRLNLMPAFSPDGEHVAFTSVRPWNGKILAGTGGIWDLELQTHELTMLLPEETSWHVHPTWSPDGSKLGFVSSRSGHNEIWVLPHGSANPVQVSFLNKNILSVCWSPDGGELAFVVNEGVDERLWKIHASGGTPQEIKINHLIYRRPMGRLQVTITDQATGRPTPARVYLRGSDRKSYAPAGTFARAIPISNWHFFHSTGSFVADLPVGRATVEVMKGFQYKPVTKQVEIASGALAKVNITLDRFFEMRGVGWISGDTHVHMNGGGTAQITPALLLEQAEAEDLDVTNGLVGNQNTGIRDLKYFTGKLNPASTTSRLLYFGEEYRESFPGHIGLLNLPHFIFPSIVAGSRVNAYPALSEILTKARGEGATVGLVHPFYGENSLLRRRSKEFPVDMALHKLQFYDAMCSWCDEFDSIEKWYRALNLGFKLPASAGTDCFADMWRNPTVGMVRFYVHSTAPFGYDKWLAGLKAGATFVTNGPLLFLKVNGQEPGARLQLPQDSPPSTVRVEADIRSIVPVERIDIVHNGKVVLSQAVESSSHAHLAGVVTISNSGWIAARAYGRYDGDLLMDRYVYAHTSPVYVRRGEQRAWSQSDADYFRDWIDEVLRALDSKCDRTHEIPACFDTSAQKEEVVRVWQQARAFYVSKH